MSRFTPCAGISHYDFDGMISGILIKKAFDVPIKYCGYSWLDRACEEMIDGQLNVIMTDISFGREQYDKYAHDFKQGTLLLIDHHSKTEEDGVHTEDGVIWDDKYAGSDLTLKWLMECHPDKFDRYKDYADLAVLAADYDLWKHTGPMSAVWNEIIIQSGFEEVEARFMRNPSIELTEPERVLAIDLLKQRNETRQYIVDNIQIATADDGHKIGVLVMQKLPFIFLEVSDYLNDEGVDFMLCIYNEKRCSMRSRKGVDISKSMWKNLFHGHKEAAGLLPEYKTEDALALLESSYGGDNLTDDDIPF